MPGHSDCVSTSDFYEDDEPVETLLAAFDAGEQGVTGPPVRGRTDFFRLESPVQSEFAPDLVGNAHRTR